MVTVVVPTTNRPQMLRTALRSIEKQTAMRHVAHVIVSENAGSTESESVCAEFPSLPIIYIFREKRLNALEHGYALVMAVKELGSSYLAYLHDDDWWGINHLATALDELEKHPDTIGYWATSFFVDGESSWFAQCWNESCWVASGFPPVTEVLKIEEKEGVLACLGSGPAHFSSFVGRREASIESLLAAHNTGNLHDGDRLLFFELAKRGPQLVNFVPEVFVRRHAQQDQRSLSFEQSSEHIAAATRQILEFCRVNGIDVVREYERRYAECPLPTYRPFIIGTWDRRVIDELRRQNALPLEHLLQAHQLPAPKALPPPVAPPLFKQISQKLCPPLIWDAARYIKAASRPEISPDSPR